MAVAVTQIIEPIPETAIQASAGLWLSGLHNTSDTLWLYLDVDAISLDDRRLQELTAWIKDLIPLAASRNWTVIALGETLNPDTVQLFNAAGAMTAQIKVDEFLRQLTAEQETAEEWVVSQNSAKPIGTRLPRRSRLKVPISQDEEFQQFNGVLKELNSALGG
jgi:hypothetical protein